LFHRRQKVYRAIAGFEKERRNPLVTAKSLHAAYDLSDDGD
jgi:hypothetical protein